MVHNGDVSALFMLKSCCDNSIDVIVVAEVTNGLKEPFPGLTAGEVMELLADGERLEITESCSEALTQLMQGKLIL
jgi:hypothetical protein